MPALAGVIELEQPGAGRDIGHDFIQRVAAGIKLVGDQIEPRVDGNRVTELGRAVDVDMRTRRNGVARQIADAIHRDGIGRAGGERTGDLFFSNLPRSQCSAKYLVLFHDQTI